VMIGVIMTIISPVQPARSAERPAVTDKPSTAQHQTQPHQNEGSKRVHVVLANHLVGILVLNFMSKIQLQIHAGVVMRPCVAPSKTQYVWHMIL
jgi:hypothetical protein